MDDQRNDAITDLIAREGCEGEGDDGSGEPCRECLPCRAEAEWRRLHNRLVEIERDRDRWQEMAGHHETAMVQTMVQRDEARARLAAVERKWRLARAVVAERDETRAELERVEAERDKARVWLVSIVERAHEMISAGEVGAAGVDKTQDPNVLAVHELQQMAVKGLVNNPRPPADTPPRRRRTRMKTDREWKWEDLPGDGSDCATRRLRIPEGWLYRIEVWDRAHDNWGTSDVVFVPEPGAPDQYLGGRPGRRRGRLPIPHRARGGLRMADWRADRAVEQLVDVLRRRLGPADMDRVADCIGVIWAQMQGVERERRDAKKQNAVLQALLGEVEGALRGCVDAMALWGSWEDGIPERGMVGNAYDRACDLLDSATTPEGE